MAKIKYGIKLALAVDDYIWVTEDTGRCDFDLRPVLYNTFDEAEKAAKRWGSLAKVEEYKPVDISQ